MLDVDVQLEDKVTLQIRHLRPPLLVLHGFNPGGFEFLVLP
jgi:hypothetical protein